MGRAKKIAIGAGLFVGLAATVFFGFVPGIVARSKNAVRANGPWTLEGEAKQRHDALLVVDMHADSLLWDVDLAENRGWGHVDLPRMRQGGLDLQGFTVVTKVPAAKTIDKNRSDSDVITALMFGQLRPPSAWFSLEARALDQAAALRALDESEPDFRLLRTRADLEAFIRDKESNPGLVGGWLGLEGSHALEGDLQAVDRLYDAGYRMFAPAHFFDNEVGGSAHGWDKGGLTDFGRQVIQRQEELGIVLDLAHASPRVVTDALAIATRPVVVSHTGVKATCDSARNLSDAQIRGVAATGGVVAIGFFQNAVCGTTLDDIVAAIMHTVEVVGADHVGFGSDFDGAEAMPFDATGMGQLTEALRARGLSDEDVAKIAGGNVVRVLGQTLPTP